MKPSKLTYLSNMWTPGGDAAGECIRQAQTIEELGYVNLNWTDQTQTWQFRAGWRPDLIPYAAVMPDHDAWFDTLTLGAAVLARTERIMLSTIIDSYRRPASVLAQALNSLDQIGHGRFLVAIGTGEDKQFEPYGMSRLEPRNTRLEDFIQTTRALMLSDKPVTRDSQYNPLRDALVGLPTYHPDRTLPIIIVGGGPRVMKIIGRSADGWGTYLPGSMADELEPFEESIARMRASAVEHDRDPEALLLPVGAEVVMLCEDADQVQRCYDSVYTRMSVMNLTPTGADWKRWGGRHPIGDDWALSVTHRSTKFTLDEVQDYCAKVRPEDIDHMIYIGTPEEVAAKSIKWYGAMGVQELPQILHWDKATFVCPELAEIGPSGKPRWHDLHLRYLERLRELLALRT
ncbi:LLM class flavin-dependent oxidoreductase [Mycolicibacterium pulveris]|uniref:Luciferase-like domain-containing protein n=1 Tax=Mycolicibacterium pulveris TaxID=36813 RepID=A0A7I7UUK5_MYCPV|nr:LLM class flavin-dependent oxidoreductase [Mycolicibacterium pulveris]MCV6983862.1 LLM class flavin-dependent oxidoreductase [Mycolicibacterium pulveris]BBY83746.1 hypothetical protein MPUL_49040 [Mycolicibacterium pulveris]